MIDIHTHILPGLDDGARDYGEALQMAELALDGEVDILVASVHGNQRGRYENYNSLELQQQFSQLQEIIREEQLEITILPGMEVMASEDLKMLIDRGEVLPLNGSDYYLVEFMFDEEPDNMNAMLTAICSMNKTPVIAHPERYFAVWDNPNLVYDWRKRGIMIQINKGSLFGMFGRRAASTAQQLLDHGLITCIASDAHEAKVRTPGLADVRRFLEEEYTWERAMLLLEENPGRLIRNEPILDQNYEPIERNRWF